MYNARIWLVVPPKIGLPLFLGVVVLLSLLVHTAVLTQTDWFPAFLQGNAVEEASAAAETSAN